MLTFLIVAAGARVDDAGQRLAIPVDREQQPVRVVLRPPLAAPRALQGMAELRDETAAAAGQPA